MRNALKKGLVKAAVAAAAVTAAVIFAPVILPFIAGLSALELGLGSFGLLIGLCMVMGGHDMAREEAKDNEMLGVSLTQGETAYTQSIFGRKIAKDDLARVRKHFCPEGSDAADVRGLRRINFYGAENHEADYSQANSEFNYATFIHEMTHIWQNQRLSEIFHSAADSIRRRKKTYDYTLSAKSRFRKFGCEQQASIIEDYALYFLHPTAYSRRIKNPPENNELLKMVVEKKFPEARKTRERLERTG